jgi:Nuclease-related domain
MADPEESAREMHGRDPGARSWERASWRMAVALSGVGCGLVAIGFAIAVGGGLGFAISALVLVLVLVLYREVDQGRLNVDRDVKGYRGERMVADLLGMLEPLGFHVIHGLEFVDRDGRRKDIDHAVVGPTGVFAVETKNWKGRMSKGPGDRLVHNGVDETRAVLQALGEAKELRRRLKAADVPVRWVEALLVSTKSTLPDIRMEFNYVTVIGASDLVPSIRGRKRVLSDKQVASAVAALVGRPASGRSAQPSQRERPAA